MDLLTDKTLRVFPLIEEMTFRASIKSEEQAITLLKYIQAVVNELGADQIIAVMQKLEKDPSIMQKILKALPYLKML